MIELVKKSNHPYEVLHGSSYVSDQEILLLAIKKGPECLLMADKNLRNNRGFILKAVQQNGLALEYASYTLKGDKKVILEALKYDKSGRCFSCINENLKNDRAFVLEAIKINGNALLYAKLHFQWDLEMIIESIKNGGVIFPYLNSEFKGNPTVALLAIKQNPMMFHEVGKNLTNSYSFLIKVKQILEEQNYKGYILQSVNSYLKKVNDYGTDLYFDL